MSEKADKSGFRMNIGGASIILLLMVFALSVFAILSIRASYNEVSLTKQSRESKLKYFQADTRAEEILQSIDEKLKELFDADTMSVEGLQTALADIPEINEIADLDGISYQVTMDEERSILVELKLHPSQKKRYTIAKWQMVVKEQEGYSEDTFEIWEPDWS